MNDRFTRERLREIFKEVFDRDDLTLTDEMTAANIEEWDSLSHVRLIVTIESAFGVRFSNSEIESMENVGRIVEIIETRSKAA